MKRSSLTAISIVKLQEYYDHPRRNPFLAKGGEKKEERKKEMERARSRLFRGTKNPYTYLFFESL